MPCNGRAELGPVTKNVDIASKCREGQGLPVSSSRFMQMKQAGCYLRVVFCPLSALGRASLAVEASTGCEMVTASGVACETHCAIQGTAWTHFRNFLCAGCRSRRCCFTSNLTWERADWPLVIFSVQEEEKRKAKEEEEKREYEEYLKLKESFIVEEEGVEESMTEEQVCEAGSAVPLLFVRPAAFCLVENELESRSQPKVFPCES